MPFAKLIADFKTEFPGWWWSVGECHVSCDASVGPTVDAPDAHLLHIREFDEGFDGDLKQPSTVEEALLRAIEIARQNRAAVLLSERHASDCALHNGPALLVGPCDCGAIQRR